jgi:hypothetical protein
MAVLALLALPTPALGQSGAIDPEQDVDHFRAFGRWEVLCDVKRTTGEKRCYIRVVDVYSPRPDFKAAFVFVTAHKAEAGKPKPAPGAPARSLPEKTEEPRAALRFEFSIEPGFAWAARPLSIAVPKRPKAGLPMVRCGQPSCAVRDDDAAALADTLAANAREGVDLVLSFREKDDALRDLAWPLAGFKEAMADFAAARSQRGLP